jgi:hydrogenase nickel incorporation protein HypA/HybF
MHELSITEELLHIISQRAAEENITRVFNVTLRIGRYSGVMEDALLFAFEALSQGTMTEGARIHIEKSSGDELQILSFEGD